jgi:F0F1-type ATP synthase assembly protein I
LANRPLGVLGFVLVKYARLPEWVYIPLILLGVCFGFFSMIKFILAATRSLERIEEEEKEKRKEKRLNGK